MSENLAFFLPFLLAIATFRDSFLKSHFLSKKLQHYYKKSYTFP